MLDSICKVLRWRKLDAIYVERAEERKRCRIRKEGRIGIRRERGQRRFVGLLLGLR